MEIKVRVKDGKIVLPEIYACRFCNLEEGVVEEGHQHLTLEEANSCMLLYIRNCVERGMPEKEFLRLWLQDIKKPN